MQRNLSLQTKISEESLSNLLTVIAHYKRILPCVNRRSSGFFNYMVKNNLQKKIFTLFEH